MKICLICNHFDNSGKIPGSCYEVKDLEKCENFIEISESIFSGKNIIIPMADVQFIEKEFWNYNSENGEVKKGDLSGIRVIMKNSLWNFENDTWENAAWITQEEAKKFISAWCYYRYEKEGGEETFKNA